MKISLGILKTVGIKELCEIRDSAKEMIWDHDWVNNSLGSIKMKVPLCQEKTILRFAMREKDGAHTSLS